MSFDKEVLGFSGGEKMNYLVDFVGVISLLDKDE